jgi:hypothetical protein
MSTPVGPFAIDSGKIEVGGITWPHAKVLKPMAVLLLGEADADAVAEAAAAELG